jgi:hypothetical protein
MVNAALKVVKMGAHHAQMGRSVVHTAHQPVPMRVEGNVRRWLVGGAGVGVELHQRRHSEWGLAAWCLGSWWCVLWIRNKLPLSNMPSSTRYNGSTGLAGTRR